MWHQAAKKLCFASERALLRETIQRLSHKRRRPFTIINFIGLPFRSLRDLRLRLLV
jgi:hypothetical protein